MYNYLGGGIYLGYITGCGITDQSIWTFWGPWWRWPQCLPKRLEQPTPAVRVWCVWCKFCIWAPSYWRYYTFVLHCLRIPAFLRGWVFQQLVWPRRRVGQVYQCCSCTGRRRRGCCIVSERSIPGSLHFSSRFLVALCSNRMAFCQHKLALQPTIYRILFPFCLREPRFQSTFFPLGFIFHSHWSIFRVSQILSIAKSSLEKTSCFCVCNT